MPQTEAKSVEMCHEELNSSRDDEFQHKERACQVARYVNVVENGKNDSPVSHWLCCMGIILHHSGKTSGGYSPGLVIT
ncbi:rCG46802 [Rattus norvegicus]|uniref:RCG46802 n=1 Tax=Rattus norvegicus TaxID=10116 RepID=A6IXA1_RAT|nr:rCG46802 [Rattus norvegicus]